MLDASPSAPALPAMPPAPPACAPPYAGDVSGTAAALVVALSVPVVPQGDALAVLHEAVCAHVRALRAGGAPPEAAVVAVKHAMEVAGVPRHGTPEHLAFAARVVTWCIEAYYRPG